MMARVDAIELGHLKPTIRHNALNGAFFLQCTEEELQSIGIEKLHRKKIAEFFPQQPPEPQSQ